MRYPKFKIVESTTSDSKLSIRGTKGEYPKDSITKHFKAGDTVVMLPLAEYESLLKVARRLSSDVMKGNVARGKATRRK